MISSHFFEKKCFVISYWLFVNIHSFRAFYMQIFAVKVRVYRFTENPENESAEWDILIHIIYTEHIFAYFYNFCQSSFSLPSLPRFPVNHQYKNLQLFDHLIIFNIFWTQLLHFILNILTQLGIHLQFVIIKNNAWFNKIF